MKLVTHNIYAKLTSLGQLSVTIGDRLSSFGRPIVSVSINMYFILHTKMIFINSLVTILFYKEPQRINITTFPIKALINKIFYSTCTYNLFEVGRSVKSIQFNQL